MSVLSSRQVPVRAPDRTRAPSGVSPSAAGALRLRNPNHRAPSIARRQKHGERSFAVTERRQSLIGAAPRTAPNAEYLRLIGAGGSASRDQGSASSAPDAVCRAGRGNCPVSKPGSLRRAVAGRLGTGLGVGEEEVLEAAGEPGLELVRRDHPRAQCAGRRLRQQSPGRLRRRVQNALKDLRKVIKGRITKPGSGS